MKDEVKFSIPEPCSENWNEMNPVEQGRFCDKCCKAVVDFSSKTTNEILDFLKASRTKSICANVYDDQLSIVPVKIPVKRRSLFFAAIYFVFGSFLFTACHSKKHARTQMRGAFLVEPASPAKKATQSVLTPGHK
jgi:hypothetical protein